MRWQVSFVLYRDESESAVTTALTVAGEKKVIEHEDVQREVGMLRVGQAIVSKATAQSLSKVTMQAATIADLPAGDAEGEASEEGAPPKARAKAKAKSKKEEEAEEAASAEARARRKKPSIKRTREAEIQMSTRIAKKTKAAEKGPVTRGRSATAGLPSDDE